MRPLRTGPRHAGKRSRQSLCVPAVTLLCAAAGTIALAVWGFA